MNQVKIVFENEQELFSVEKNLKDLVSKLVKETLAYAEFNEDVEIGISFVDNERIREINKQFRNKDSATDVLSFPLLDFDEEKKLIRDYSIGDYNHDEELLLMGDIVISLEKAMEQAEEYGHSFEREIGFLTVHSMFHLLGYDHEREEEATVMHYHEEQVLKKLNLTRS